MNHCVVNVVYVQDVLSFPELAVSHVLIGQLDFNEYLTVDSATLLHCPCDDDASSCRITEAHFCLSPGILSPQPMAPSVTMTTSVTMVPSIDERLSSTVPAETVILRLASLLKQLLLTRLKTTSTSSM